MPAKAKTLRFTHGFDKYEARSLNEQDNFASNLNEILDPLNYQEWVNQRFHGDRREREYDRDLGCWVLKVPQRLKIKPKFRRKTNQRQRIQAAQVHLGLQALGL